MRRVVLGLLIGLAIGLPTGAAAWYLYDDTRSDDDVAEREERERADELATQLIGGCGICTVARLDKLAPEAWRMIVEAENQRYCFRMDLDSVEPDNVDGFGDLFEPSTPGIRKTACQ